MPPNKFNQSGFSFDESESVPILAQTSMRDGISSVFKMFEPTEVFNAYWRFAVERQRIFFSRLKGRPSPWTADSILQQHKFTNAYRVLDRVSQFLVRHVQRDEDSKEDWFFRTILFKFFNKIETWEMLEAETPEITWKNYHRNTIEKALARVLKSGLTIYSAAYIMPSGGEAYKGRKKHEMHLDLIEKMMADDLPHQIAGCMRMQDVYELLLSYPSIGTFLAYQYATDLNYTALTNFSESGFVVAGPGAKRGVDKAFGNKRGLSYEELIMLVYKSQKEEFSRLDLDFQKIDGRELQPIDCQNLFCEIDKYSRKAFPRFNSANKPSRIKQKFSPKLERLSFVLPSKWKAH